MLENVKGSVATIPLSEARRGMRVRVVSVPTAVPHIKRLAEMGFTEGAEVSVVRVAPLGDPVEMSLRGYRVCVRRSDAAGIEVEVLD